MTEETIAQSEEAIQMEVGDGSGIPLETETNREDSEISWTKDTKTAPGVINWRALAAEFTWENLWTKRDYKSIGKHFFVSLCTGLFFSGFDIFTTLRLPLEFLCMLTISAREEGQEFLHSLQKPGKVADYHGTQIRPSD